MKDKIALTVSILALSVSSLNLYWSQLRASYKVEAVVLEADALGGRLTYQVAILNQGTHRIVVTEARLEQDAQDQSLSTSSPFSEVLGPELPVVVGPKDVVVLTFKGQLNLGELYSRGSHPLPGDQLAEFDGVATRLVTIHSTIQVLDFRGRSAAVSLGGGTYHTTPIAVASSQAPTPAVAYFALPN